MTLASAPGEGAGAVPAARVAGAVAVAAAAEPGLVSAGLVSGFSGDFLDAPAGVAGAFAATFPVSGVVVAAGLGGVAHAAADRMKNG